MATDIEIFPAYRELLEPAPFKLYYGGRGAAKSWQFTDALLIDSFKGRHRIACLRETMESIKESVHAIISARIHMHGMQDYFQILRDSIRNKYTGTEFFYRGLKGSEQTFRSTFGITRAWIEEAEYSSATSLEALLPTLRTPGVELWASWNPETENSAIDSLMKKPPTGAIVRKVGYRDNPHFPVNLEQQRLDMLRDDPVLYEHVWEGGYRKIGAAAILAKRITVKDFDTPDDARFYHGVDWGYAEDPLALIRSFIIEDGNHKDLYIDEERFAHGIELEEIAPLFDTIPTTRRWPIKADNSQPQTISYVKRKGFDIVGADKWQGSVDDGIVHLQGFRNIFIHTRCPKIAREGRLYSWKVDKKTGDILPMPLDRDNHGWDAVRYSLDKYIKPKKKGFFD